ISHVISTRACVPKELLKTILQRVGEGRIDDDHLAPPQAQDLPDDGADVVHIHLLYDVPRLDLSLKSIAQSIKFIGRFGDEQRQLRQKGQFVYSRHLFAPMKLLSRASMARLRNAAGESPLALQ